MKPVLRIPKWHEFQHYKDRSAPWIKAYRELLLDDEWHELTDASKAHVFGLWLLAANYDGKIPFKPLWIARQIAASTAINWRELASSKWVALNAPASEVLAELEHDASLRALAREEGEESREEGEGKRRSTRSKNEVPADYAPPADLVEKARTELRLSDAVINAQTIRFVTHHRAKGNTFKRVDLAWWNWVSGRFVDVAKSEPKVQMRMIRKAE